MNALTLQNNLIDPFTALDRAQLSDTTRRQYRRAIELYLNTGSGLGDAAALADYAAGLKSSPRAFLKSALKLWAKEVERVVKAGSTPETVNAVLATLHRLDALNDTIKVSRQSGNRAHTWLTAIETKRLLNAATSKRDKLILALLVGAGLRRDEAVTLRYADVEKLGDRTILNVCGKGSKDRVIPISSVLAEMIEGSKTAPTQADGLIMPLSGQAVCDVVSKYGAAIGKPGLRPHDLRRSYAQFGLDNGVSIPQISRLLGHANIQTTMRYLNQEVDLTATISDFVPIA